MDDLTPLHQLNATVANSEVYLFQPRDTYNTQSINTAKVPYIGTNPSPGAAIKYYLKHIDRDDSTELVVNIRDAAGNLLRSYSSNAQKDNHKASKQSGMNALYWDLQTEPIKVAEGVMPAGPAKELPGYTVGPGNYVVELTYGETTRQQTFAVKADPRDGVPPTAYDEKLTLVKKLYQEVDNLYRGLVDLQEVREQIDRMTQRLPDDQEINDMGDEIIEKINSVEDELISPKQETFQDIINYRNKLDRQLYNLLQTIDGNIPPVTEGEKELSGELLEQWQEVQQELNTIIHEDIGNFNDLLRQKGVQYIAPSKGKNEKPKKAS